MNDAWVFLYEKCVCLFLERRLRLLDQATEPDPFYEILGTNITSKSASGIVSRSETMFGTADFAELIAEDDRFDGR